MKESLNDIRFTLTPKMAKYLVQFSDSKTELEKTKKMFDETKDDKLLKKIKTLELKLEKFKTLFLNEFKNGNKKELEKYVALKDQD